MNGHGGILIISLLKSIIQYQLREVEAKQAGKKEFSQEKLEGEQGGVYLL